MSDNNTGLRVVKQESEMMTVEKLIKLFPEKKRTINEQTVEIINSSMSDPTFDGYSFENTLVEYRKVMDRRSGSIKDYICAVKFVAYLEGGHSDLDAYRMAFAHRELVRSSLGKPASSPEYLNVSTSAHRFKKTPMVLDIMTMADVPMYLLHQGTRHAAVGVLADMMMNAGQDKDRISAATAILKEIKEPEKIKMEMEIGLNEDAHAQIKKTNDQLVNIAENQQKLFAQGIPINQLQQIHTKKNEDAIEVEID